MGLPITKMVISHTCFDEMRNKLDWCGINRAFVYPGLDGVASYVDLKASNKHWEVILNVCPCYEKPDCGGQCSQAT